MSIVQLFQAPPIRAACAERLRSLGAALDGRDDGIVAAERENLVHDLVNRYRIEPVELALPPEKGGVHDEVTQVGRSRARSIRVQMVVRFTGDHHILGWRPRRFPSEVVVADVRAGRLTIAVRLPEGRRGELEQEFARLAAHLKTYIDHGRPEIDAYNDRVEELARHIVDRRIRELSQLQEDYDALPFPLIRREEPLAPRLPVVRRQVHRSPPPSPTSPSEAYALDATIYEEVLDVLDRAARQMERSPETMRRIGENMRRDLMLVALNAVFEVGAMGEAFSGAGKTDILLRAGSGNVFVGEAKIWDGEKTVIDGLEQLLGYVTWRDTKAALILFTGRKDATRTIDLARAAVASHAQCLEAPEPVDASVRSDFVFSHADDPHRRIRLALLPAVVPDPDLSEDGTPTPASG